MAQIKTIFTRKEFETALSPEWEYVGAFDSEECYLLKIDDKAGIWVTSSIHNNTGKSDTVGQDWIRCWLVAYDFRMILGEKNVYATIPLGEETYILRVEGWDEQIDKVFQELWTQRTQAGDCEICKKPLVFLKVKKEGPTKGRMFATCKNRKHKSFRWID